MTVSIFAWFKYVLIFVTENNVHISNTALVIYTRSPTAFDALKGLAYFQLSFGKS